MRIAITGGTGFVGRALARRLEAAGHESIVLSRRTGHALDLAHIDRLAATFAGCEAIVHCAGINRELGDQTYERVHVEGTTAVVEGARRAGVRRIVMLSFLRARPDWPDRIPPLQVGRRGARSRVGRSRTRSSRPESSTAGATTCSTT